MDIIERDIYALIVSGDGIKAREIAKKLNKDRSTVNHYLYNSPYMKDLCYRDENYEWYGLIRQSRPHVGLGDYSGYYGTVAEFLELTEDEWFQMLTEGCRKIGRNLNDTRGLFHSFRDSYEVMKNLFVRKRIIAVNMGFMNVAMFNPRIVKKSGSYQTEERTNGLSYASEYMKGSPLCYQITMSAEECERSELAMDAIRRL